MFRSKLKAGATSIVARTRTSTTTNNTTNALGRQHRWHTYTQELRRSSSSSANSDNKVIVSEIYETASKFGEVKLEEIQGGGGESDKKKLAAMDTAPYDFTQLVKRKNPYVRERKPKLENLDDADREPVYLAAKVRTIDDSRRCRNMRKYEKRIPGVFYGTHDDGSAFSTNISLDMKTIAAEMRIRAIELENTLYELDIEGLTKSLVVARQTQINPIDASPLAINFLKYRAGTKIRVPLKYTNMDDCVDIKRGCFLVRINKFVEVVMSEGTPIPSSIKVDISSYKNKDVIRLENATLPPGVNPSIRNDGSYVLAIISNK